RVAVGAEAACAIGDVGVRRTGLRAGCAPCHCNRGAHHRRTEDEPTATRLAFEHAGGLVHQPVGEADSLALARRCGHAATSRTTAMVFGSEVNARNTSEHPITRSSR